MKVTELIAEMLPAKAASELYKWKNQQNQPSVQEPRVPTQEPSQQPQKPLAQLQKERAKLNQVIQLKGQIEQLTARAERTRMGIPRGLAADLEVDYEPKSEKDYDDLIVLYQRQIKQLSDHISRQRNVYRESVLKENKNNKFVRDHIQWLADQLDIKKLPKIKLLNEPMETTFGMYSPENKCIYLVTGGRHPVDVLRTLAHELTHYKQDSEDNLPPGAGETGTDQENEANANAGIVMRDFADARPEYFGIDEAIQVNKSAELATQQTYTTPKNPSTKKVNPTAAVVNHVGQQPKPEYNEKNPLVYQRESLEDTPPEVIAALNQAAKKSGYASWDDVCRHPKSPGAKMQVAKLASVILRMPPLHKPTKTF